MTSAQLTALKAELANDPASLGLVGASDAVCADKLNAVPGNGGANFDITKGAITGAELACAVDRAEFAALSAADRQYVSMVVCAPGNLTGGDIKTAFEAIFGAGSATRTKISALLKRTVSRAEKMFGQAVTPSDVAEARKAP